MHPRLGVAVKMSTWQIMSAMIKNGDRTIHRVNSFFRQEDCKNGSREIVLECWFHRFLTETPSIIVSDVVWWNTCGLLAAYL